LANRGREQQNTTGFPRFPPAAIRCRHQRARAAIARATALKGTPCVVGAAGAARRRTPKPLLALAFSPGGDGVSPHRHADRERATRTAIKKLLAKSCLAK